MTEQFANLAQSTLNGAILAGATSLVVSSASSFPTTGTFRIVIDTEIFIVTGVSGTTFTVTPGAEGTTQAGHANGATVTHILTAAVMTSIVSQLNRAYLTQSFSSQTSITVTHNFGYYPITQVLDNTGAVTYPASITNTSVNALTVTFSSVSSGTIILTAG